MPELPDVVVYQERIQALAGGAILHRLRLASPFVLRTVEPPVAELADRRLDSVRRLGKRLVLVLEGERYAVLHLMIAGRLHWKKAEAPIPKGRGLAAFDFSTGTMLFTEAGKKKRASIHLVRGEAGLADFDRGGLEVLGSGLAAFQAAITRESHTLKRALTDPSILSGIGNAYSDEIVHRARLSPFKRSDALSGEEMTRLHGATQAVLSEWVERLRAQAGDSFPEKVTAFREEMAVHGRFGKPCPVCGAPVQRIVYAENEANYCAGCQTEGRVLADRALSRLLKDTWPRTLEELQQRLPPKDRE
jgi:formamidopyrimidine-DNA glycosylase